MRPYKKKRSAEVAFRFGQNLARARQRARLSQEELAKRASLHRTEIGMLEQGQRVARIDTVTKLAGAMGIEPQELLDGIHWTPSDVSGGGFSFSDREAMVGEAGPGCLVTRPPGAGANS